MTIAAVALLGAWIGLCAGCGIGFWTGCRQNRNRHECASKTHCQRRIPKTAGSDVYAYGSADPRCGGGNCTACCKELCGGRCGKVALGVIGGGKVLPFGGGKGA